MQGKEGKRKELRDAFKLQLKSQLDSDLLLKSHKRSQDLEAELKITKLLNEHPSMVSVFPRITEMPSS